MNKQDYLHIGKAVDLTDWKDRFLYRLFETIPAIFSWGFLALLVVFSFLFPAVVAIFVILFAFFWLVRVLYLTIHLRSSYRRMRQTVGTNWWDKLRAEKSERYKDLWHLVVLPMYNEPYGVVRETLQALKETNYDHDKIILVLATEERAGETARIVSQKAKEEFGDYFYKFIITTHPAGIEGELAGKGSNEAWAAKIAKKEAIDPLGLSYENVIVSVFDIDTVVVPVYFALLSYRYLEHPNPTRASFQPIPLYTNNVWQAPALARVLSFSGTFWHMMQQERPERQATFSSHSMSLRALVDIGWWQTNVVSEDSRIFWQCYLYYNGDYEVVSLFCPVSMDANVAPNFWRTMLNQYKQQRRWGWGVENVPYVLFGFLKNKKIKLSQKIFKAVEVVEGYHSWATNSIILFLMGWLPVFVGGAAFNVSLLSYNLPRITQTLMTFALVGVMTSMVLSINLLPPRPVGYGAHRYALMVVQWALLPVLLILFGSLPALEAQTRLAFGKYMGFWVTPKSREGGGKREFPAAE